MGSLSKLKVMTILALLTERDYRSLGKVKAKMDDALNHAAWALNWPQSCCDYVHLRSTILSKDEPATPLRVFLAARAEHERIEDKYALIRVKETLNNGAIDVSYIYNPKLSLLVRQDSNGTSFNLFFCHPDTHVIYPEINFQPHEVLPVADCKEYEAELTATLADKTAL